MFTAERMRWVPEMSRLESVLFRWGGVLAARRAIHATPPKPHFRIGQP